MRLKPIIKLCKETMSITLFNYKNCQWVSNGYAIYPLIKMPILNEDTVFTVFEIPDEKIEGYTLHIYEDECHLISTFNLADVLREDQNKILNKSKIEINIYGNIYYPYETTKGVALVEPKYLEPFKDINDIELFERYTDSGRLYIVAKKGMLLQGIFLPSNNIIDEQLCSQLQDLTSRCCSVLTKEEQA